MLYVLNVLAHHRRRVLHFNVTVHPTAARTALPDETATRFLLRDRDPIYGEEFRLRVAGMKIEEVITSARSLSHYLMASLKMASLKPLYLMKMDLD